MGEREDVLLPLVRGKKVLDCGGMDHDAFESKDEAGDWLHGLIAAEAAECLGVDILEERVERMNAEGRFRFHAGNVEELEFDAEFDVVVGGEIIEHVFNPGRFLDSAWRALRPDGRLVLTTPNSFGLSPMLRALVRGVEVCHPEHTCWYSPQTLRYLVERHGFEVEALHLVGRPAASRLTAALRSTACWLRPLLAEQLVLVGRKQPTQTKHAGLW